MKDIEEYFRVYAEVNLDAIIKNIEMMREKLNLKQELQELLRQMDMVMELYPLQKHLKMNALVMQQQQLGKDTILEDTALISRCTYWELFLKTCAIQ